MALPALAETLHIEEPCVFINNGKAVTTSRQVAAYFGKQHFHVTVATDVKLAHLPM